MIRTNRPNLTINDIFLTTPKVYSQGTRQCPLYGVHTGLFIPASHNLPCFCLYTNPPPKTRIERLEEIAPSKHSPVTLLLLLPPSLHNEREDLRKW
jgi:hypothetical protein